jgi:DNA gyrase subunit B
MYEGGVEAFVAYLDRQDAAAQAADDHPGRARRHRRSRFRCSGTMATTRAVLCFTNNIPQRDGGTHLAGFRGALTRCVNKYAEESGILKKEKVTLSGDDSREGLTCVLSVKVPDPKFSSQTKDKLVSSEVRPAVENLVNEQLAAWFEEHPSDAKHHRRQGGGGRRRARSGAQGARTHPPQGRADMSPRCPASLPIARSAIRPSPNSSSSRAIAPAARPSRAATAPIRPILPLRGKILNVERARFDKMLSSAEIGTLITALGTGIGHDDFDLAKLRYHKIIIMTDADVDGAHIRTLLLTFFFRQMRPLIDAGHLYIAQPPLYKVKRGQSERYLKDEAALEQYLIGEGLEGAVLNLQDGSQRAGADLRRMVDQARQARAMLDSAGKRYNAWLVEQAAVLGLLRNDVLDDAAKSVPAAEAMAQRLNALASDLEKGWECAAPGDGTLVARRSLRGYTESYLLDAPLFRSAEARKLNELADELQAAYLVPAQLRRKDETHAVRGPSELLEAVMTIGKRGLTMQRYKGLGEMNPEQLWETTLDPNVRSLLQVKVDHAEDADNIFETLMGDVVEPRRDFIQSNALAVANLDI